MNYKLVRSNRKTVAIRIENGEVIVKAPLSLPLSYIEDFVCSHEGWIARNLSQAQSFSALPPITAEELDSLADKAVEYIPDRVAHYAKILGVSYGMVTIRNQRTRWGSCSSKKNLNFNCLLMLAPHEVIDSVVVHELCHLKEMNHSKRFYELVLSVYPDYHKHHSWLKKNGNSLMARMEKGLK